MNHHRVCNCTTELQIGFHKILWLLTLSLVAWCLVSFEGAVAAERGTLQLSQKIGKPLKEAQLLMEQKKWREAIDKIDKEIIPLEGKTPVEDAAINENKAFCLKQINDNEGAMTVIETMLAKNQVAADQIHKRIAWLTGINYELKHYERAVEYGERYIKEYGATQEIDNILMKTFYAKNDFSRSSDYAKKIINRAIQASQSPSKDSLDYFFSTQYKLDKNDGIAEALELLLTYYPNPDLWRYIFIYINKEASYSDQEALEVLRLKFVLNLLKPENYLEMAELCLANQDPGLAKVVLAAGLANGTIKSSERNKRLFEKAKIDSVEAAKNSLKMNAAAKDNPAALINAGLILLGLEDYPAAADKFERGLQLNQIGFPSYAFVAMGVTYVKLGRKTDALKAFRRVPHSSKLARIARLWGIYTNQQLHLANHE